MQLFYKIFNAIANSVDPEQTKEQCDLGLWHSLVLILPFLALFFLYMLFSQKLCCAKFKDIYRTKDYIGQHQRT